jgi:hypothetical protein
MISANGVLPGFGVTKYHDNIIILKYLLSYGAGKKKNNMYRFVKNAYSLAQPRG